MNLLSLTCLVYEEIKLAWPYCSPSDDILRWDNEKITAEAGGVRPWQGRTSNRPTALSKA